MGETTDIASRQSGNGRRASATKRIAFAPGTNPLQFDLIRSAAIYIENIQHLFHSVVGAVALIVAELNLVEMERLSGIEYTPQVDIRVGAADVVRLLQSLRDLLEEIDNPDLNGLLASVGEVQEMAIEFKAIFENRAEDQRRFVCDMARGTGRTLLAILSDDMINYISSEYLTQALKRAPS